MAFVRLASALVAASMLAVASASAAPAVTAPPALTPSVSLKNPIATPTTTHPASQIVEIGCFATPGPSFENHGPYLFQTEGNCQLICLQLEKNVLAVSDGTDCWCGDTIPAPVYQVDNSTCDTTCSGDNHKICGGPNLLWVALSGNTRNKVSSDPNPSSTSSSTTTSASAQPVSSSGPKASKGGSSTIAIAVGVVVGIVGVFALGFGVWFFLRRRRQRQAEEDYRRQAANVNSFVNGGKHHTSSTSSMNDSRLDPSFVDRRQSNGSIADNEDYSRRILKVTNA